MKIELVISTLTLEGVELDAAGRRAFEAALRAGFAGGLQTPAEARVVGTLVVAGRFASPGEAGTLVARALGGLQAPGDAG